MGKMKVRSHEELVEYWEDKELEKAEFQGHNGRWVTLDNGQKVFIREGESVNDAIGRLKPKEKPNKTYLDKYSPNIKEFISKKVNVEFLTKDEFRSKYSTLNAPAGSVGLYVPHKKTVFVFKTKRYPDGKVSTIHHELHHSIWHSKVSHVPGIKWVDDQFTNEVKSFRKAMRKEGPITDYSATWRGKRHASTHYPAENFAEVGHIATSSDPKVKAKLNEFPLTKKAYKDFMRKFEEVSGK